MGRVQVVSFHCVLKNTFGKVLGSSFNHDVLTQPSGPSDQLIALSEGLKDLKTGERRTIRVSAAEAYGFYDPSKVVVRSRDELPVTGSVRVGDRIPLKIEGQRQVLRVIETSGDRVTLDGNHPLAGQDLVFEIEATAAREATPEEISDSIETEAVPGLH